MSLHAVFALPLLYMPGLIFEGLVRTRNRLYRAGMLPQRRLPRPVVSVGNLTQGGAGKTPLVIYLAGLLRDLGGVPALLSRGYGRNAQRASHILAPGEEITDPAWNLGDEPALVRRRIREIWLGISMDRYRAGQKILERSANLIFLLDDGFQHLRLHRDLDVVVIDRTQPLEKNRIFPRGTLREPLSGLRRCHIVVINGLHDRAESDPLESLLHTIHPESKIFRCAQPIDSLIPFPHWKDPQSGAPDCLAFDSAFLVAAVGNPYRFRSNIEALGISVKGVRFFRDHHRLDRYEWKACVEEARRATADVLITTEKDAIKLTQQPDFPLLVSVQSTRLENQDEFRQIFRSLIKDAR